MKDKEKHTFGAGMLDRLIQGQRSGKSSNEIMEGIKVGLSSDYLSLDEGLNRGATVVDPAKYARAVDAKDEKPRKVGPIVRDINERLEHAKREVAAEQSSPEYRAKVLKQKRALIHRVMNERGTNEITANVRGYDMALLRLPETDANGMRKLKIFINGNENPDRDFDAALAEVAGLNDSQAFNAAANVGMELKTQAGIQGARTATQAGLNALTAPGRAVARSNQKNNMMAAEVMRVFLRMILSMSRAR